MPIIIGKSILGDLGLCLNPSKMGNQFTQQLEKVKQQIPDDYRLAITSITGSREIEATNGEYLPKIREYDSHLRDMFEPNIVYRHVQMGFDSVRPGADFVIWDSRFYKICGLTFSREAPVLAFKSSNGHKALGVILRKSLLKHGDYLFETIKNAMNGQIAVTLVCCNHFEYEEGSIPSIVENLAKKYDMPYVCLFDSEKTPDCYQRNEKGNQVVALC